MSNWHVSFSQHQSFSSTIYTSGTYLTTPCRATRSVFGPELLSFPLKADKASFRMRFRRTVMYKSGHNSCLQHATRKIETCGPASNVVELEWTLYTVSRAVMSAKTDVRVSREYSPMFVWWKIFARAQSTNGLP